MDQPQAVPIRVALNRVRRCPVELPSVFWPQKGGNSKGPSSSPQDPDGEWTAPTYEDVRELKTGRCNHYDIVTFM